MLAEMAADAFQRGQEIGRGEAAAEAADSKVSNEYQTVINGKLVTVNDLTLAQTRQEICKDMDAIEDLDNLLAEATDVIMKWRRG